VDHYLTRAAFGSPAPGTYSSLGAFTIVNPSTLQIDTGLSRTFQVREAQNIQFRWEVFNVTNSVSFDAADLIGSDLDSRNTFGKYSSTLSSPRVMQFGLRFEF
jgi:hypothetical protein